MSCKWNREREDYIADGEPCRKDDDGRPTRHCTARRTCSVHIGPNELTCPRCIGRTRQDVRQIVALASLMMPAALDAQDVNSEAANLAAPATDVRNWSERRVAMNRHLDTWTALGRITEEQHLHAIAAMPDDDELHPYSVLTRWQMMLSEDYGHDLPTKLGIGTAAAYLERNLPRIANDEEQDFPHLARELRRVRNHLESVIRNSSAPERGKPCPECRDEGHFIRLVREFGHWCTDEDCEQQFHYSVRLDRETRQMIPDTSGDTWVCRREPIKHRWTDEAYRHYVDTANDIAVTSA